MNPIPRSRTPRFVVLTVALLGFAVTTQAADGSKAPHNETSADLTFLNGSPTTATTQILLGTSGVEYDGRVPANYYSNVIPGTHVTLGVNINASLLAEIKWYKNDVDTGITTATFDIPSASASDSGSYFASIKTNPASSLYTFQAVLHVETLAGRRLLNLSTRAALSASQPYFISGFVASPSTYKFESKGVLIRAVGPTLANFGVTNPLPDPVIEVFDASGKHVDASVSSDPSIALIAAKVGAFPLPSGSKDAAATYSLPAGVYSVRVSSASSAAGTVLLEIYDIALTE